MGCSSSISYTDPQSVKVKTVHLANGQNMPVFGLGTYLTTNQAEIINLLRSAFDTGYRHIDTAKYYENEKLIGDALQVIFKEGKYKREDLFIVTKQLPIKGESVEAVLKQQLKDLQVDYVDLLYLHCPFMPPEAGFQGWNHKPVHQAWAEFEAVYDQKLTRGLGVSNFNAMAICDLLSYCKIKPVANQIELHVFLQQTRFVEFLKKVKIEPVAFSPLAKFTSIINNKELQDIAKLNKATVPQILLTFLLNQGITVIPKTEKVERLKENFESISQQLSPQDIQKLKGLNSNTRIFDNQGEFQGFFKGVPLFS